VTARKLSETHFDICIFDQNGDYVVYNSAVDISSESAKCNKKFL